MDYPAPTQQEIIASLPSHLRPFVQVQDYQSQYTARDQAVWRFLMTALSRSLASSAHPVYRQGLERTGIALDHIPSIDEMNACLAKLGWRAVVVDGFIPPAIFMEFQTLKVLVIALDMRSVDHLLYTPAPDILHESAGHAPFLVDVDYSEFLQRFGEVGMRAIANRHDHETYEAVRELSILKESDASESAIKAAESRLSALATQEVDPSEAALLTRLHWWTVEYGLVGEVSDYSLFGAGLLSSLGESQSCLDDEEVKKLPLTVNAIDTSYDITSTQPQLYVTRSCKHMSQVLEEFAASMAYQRGGAFGLRRAIDAATVCTATYDSGVQVSGVFSSVRCDAVGNVVYIQTSGPTQLAFADKELYGHSTSSHQEGFGAPVGLLKDFSRCLSEYTVDELKAHNIEMGQPVVLEFLSGITVSGFLRDIVRLEHRNLLLSFEKCTVTALDGEVLFDPSWGTFDMTIGGRIASVSGGVADRERYQLYKSLPQTQTSGQPIDPDLMAIYAAVSGPQAQSEDSGTLVSKLTEHLNAAPKEWLLRSELLRETNSWLPSELRDRAKSELDSLVNDPQHRRALQLVHPGMFD